MMPATAMDIKIGGVNIADRFLSLFMPWVSYGRIAMKIARIVSALVIALCLAMPSAALAAKAKKYQVTGIVLAVTTDVITVQKGDEKWEIDRETSTKITGDLKVGAKVTIEYTMSAATVEVKEAPAATAPATKPK